LGLPDSAAGAPARTGLGHGFCYIRLRFFGDPLPCGKRRL
jgi:hypothetical protein